MKVIFVNDVLPHHRAGEVKEVKNGFGRNYLLPRGYARMATPSALKQLTSLRAAAEERRRKESMDWQELAEGLSAQAVTIQARSGPTGKLYGSVTNAQIAERISEVLERPIERRRVQIQYPIRQLGSYTVHVRLFEDISADVRVVVEPEGGSSEAAPSTATAAEPSEPQAESEAPTA